MRCVAREESGMRGVRALGGERGGGQRNHSRGRPRGGPDGDDEELRRRAAQLALPSRTPKAEAAAAPAAAVAVAAGRQYVPVLAGGGDGCGVWERGGGGAARCIYIHTQKEIAAGCDGATGVPFGHQRRANYSVGDE
jgi:hypothetical protein